MNEFDEKKPGSWKPEENSTDNDAGNVLPASYVGQIDALNTVISQRALSAQSAAAIFHPTTTSIKQQELQQRTITR